MTVNTGVLAPWATLDDVCAPCAGADVPSDLLDRKLLAASNVLFRFSGRQFPGVGSDTVQPCARSLYEDHGRPFHGSGWVAGPYMGGVYSPWGFCGCNRSERAGCNSIPEITLGVYPLRTITQVLVDGVALDPSRYRVDDDRFLVRLPDANGTNPGWPCCQDAAKPTTAVGTWSVTFTYGVAPPQEGVDAAAELGCQLALACDPGLAGLCQLPQRVQRLSRQGVDVVLLDPMPFLDELRTSIFSVDLFLKAVNPKGISRRASVLTPDIGRRVRRAGTS